ncbi:head completion/stabilization protein [Aeromonas veronii]
MTSGFIPTPTPEQDEGVITAGLFWPPISLPDMRATMRTDGTVTTERLRHAVINAISQVQADLAVWAASKQAAGYLSLDAVPATLIDEESILALWYRRAVYSYARASLYERYLDSAATAEAVKDASAKDLTADDLYRDARFAIRDILGVSHTTVELI